MEARLDVLLAIWHRFVFFNVPLEGSRETGDAGRESVDRKRRRSTGLIQGRLTFRRIMSISEYFMPFTRIGISLKQRPRYTKWDSFSV